MKMFFLVLVVIVLEFISHPFVESSICNDRNVSKISAGRYVVDSGCNIANLEEVKELVHISGLFYQPNSLQKLSISRNDIGDIEFLRISPLISSSTRHLTEFMCARCGLSDRSADALVSLIQNSKFLKSVDIMNNKLTKFGISKVISACLRSGICRQVFVSGNLATHSEIHDIKRCDREEKCIDVIETHVHIIEEDWNYIHSGVLSNSPAADAVVDSHLWRNYEGESSIADILSLCHVPRSEFIAEKLDDIGISELSEVFSIRPDSFDVALKELDLFKYHIPLKKCLCQVVYLYWVGDLVDAYYPVEDAIMTVLYSDLEADSLSPVPATDLSNLDNPASSQSSNVPLSFRKMCRSFIDPVKLLSMFNLDDPLTTKMEPEL